MGTTVNNVITSLNLTKEEILNDYRIACESRQISLLGWKEVFMGKAKFGIFGDGKEVAQLAMAKVFRKGDFRSGYYRDQTFMFAINELTPQQFFAQLYAHTDVEADPASAGRQMNAHFATRSLNNDGSWKNLTEIKNSAADISSTAGQMPRLVGLAYASKLYRQNLALHPYANFSVRGNEVAFGTIGNASTSEGLFLESINAAGVLQIPMLISVWDDGYGISVPNKYHTTKGDISKALSGFQRTDDEKGIEIFRVYGWDYEGLCDAYANAARLCREEHVPVLMHILEMTQPQGHSTSGSHKRYKNKERMDWEEEYDCIRKMKEWILYMQIATRDELEEIEKQAKETAKTARNQAWAAYTQSIKGTHQVALQMLQNAAQASSEKDAILEIREKLSKTIAPTRKDGISSLKKALRLMRFEQNGPKTQIIDWLKANNVAIHDHFNSHLHSQSHESAVLVDTILPDYDEQSMLVDGREVIQACFDKALEREPKLFFIGEDVGKIGDVNQGLAGLQSKYGEMRVTDTGIRESTIIGQGVGAALRGLRPVAEIQYLDYLVYALQTITDDLASLHYRTKGGQKAPLIIRTRGHRLEGIWHSGSPMSMILGSMRGIHILVPRNMTQAAGFYNTLLLSDEPALMIECLNGYRQKERMPSNIGELRFALGIPEILREGTDITIVTYGAMCRIALKAAHQLELMGISCEVIDVQTLLPFDINHHIVASIQKTSRVIFADEDVEGGASAFMMQQVLEIQEAYKYLDAQPVTIAAKPHRPAYGSDGDYFSKPNAEDIIDAAYKLMHEADPQQFPPIYE